MRSIAALLLAATFLEARSAAELSARLSSAGLDPAECYRVRDLALYREDLRFYFTDGYLIFGKPVIDSPVTAIFVTSVQGGDAEMLALPPNKSERQSLAKFTGSPNLNEHFKAVVLMFTDGAYRELMDQIRAGESNRKSPEMGLTLASEWSSTLKNLVGSFESRIALDLLSAPRDNHGLFLAAIQGATLGNFDVIYDTRSRQQITIGQTAYRNDRVFFDVWTAFESRSVRNRSGPAPEPEFTVDDFRIHAAITGPGLALDTVTRAKVKPKARGLAALPFELSRRMKLSSVLIDGQPAEVFERESMRANLINDHGNYLFLVVPSQPLDAGREYEFEFRHSGNVIVDAGNKVYYVGSRGNWYPNRGLQFASFDVTFDYPKDLDLVAAGEVASDIVEGGRKITRRRTTSPVRLFGFNLGVYERVKITRGSLTIEMCANQSLEQALQPRPTPPPISIAETAPASRGRPGRPQPPMLGFPTLELPPNPISPAARVRELANDVAAAMEFMTARFGPPPLPTVTVSPLPGTFGQGFPGMIYLSTLSYLSPGDRPLARMRDRYKVFFSDLLYAHEAAHQWWGNIVASSGYQHDWLLEALANYSALMYLEKRKGPKALESVLSEYREDLLSKLPEGGTVDSAGPIALGSRLESSLEPNAWRVIVYEKGSWILHMLRGTMGDERFTAFLAELRKRYEWKSLDMESFRALAAEFLPPKSPDPKLESFFDQWVYSTGVPALKVKQSISGKAPALKLTVTVEQTGVEDDFSAAVPVEIQFGGRLKPITRLVRTSSEPVTFTIPLRQRPSKIVLDPANAVLAVKD